VKRVAVVGLLSFVVVMASGWTVHAYAPNGEPTPEVLVAIEQAAPVGGLAPAVRLNPPTTTTTTTMPPLGPLWSTESSNGRCTGLVFALTHLSPGWDVWRMAGIAYRESRCQPNASNSCCSGVLQMHRMHVPVPSCGVWSRADLYDPWKNICAAAELWKASGYGAWSVS